MSRREFNSREEMLAAQQAAADKLRRQIIRWGIMAATAVVGLVLFTSATYVVNAGYRGVVLTQGAITGVSERGFHWQVPWFQNVVFIDVREQTTLFENIEVYSRDQQTATVRLSVSWRVNEATVDRLYESYTTVANARYQLIDRVIEDAFKPVFSQYTAQTSIQERARLNSEVSAAIISRIRATDLLIPVSVQVEDVAFDDVYEAAINRQVQAEVAVRETEQTTARQIVQAEADARIRVIDAQATADAQVAAATANAEATRLNAVANAEAIRLRGEAEATAITAKGEALAATPGLTAYIIAEQWNGVLPTTMIPGAAVPMLQLPVTTP